MQVLSATFRISLLIALGGAFGACRSLPWKSASKEAESADATLDTSTPSPAAMRLPVGTVELVDEVGGFVLVRSGRGLQLEPGSHLTIHGDQGETVATVSVSPARKGPFLTADIVSGSPKKGQRATAPYSAGASQPPPFPGPADSPDAIQILE